jgi:hypothetical protein
MSGRFLSLGFAGLLAALILFSAAAGRAEPVTPAAITPPVITPAVDIANLDQPVPTLTLGRVVGVVTGIAFGEVVLHGLMGLPGLPSIVAGGVAGWHVYTSYIEPQVRTGVRRIAAAADDARLYWTASASRDPG